LWLLFGEVLCTVNVFYKVRQEIEGLPPFGFSTPKFETASGRNASAAMSVSPGDDRDSIYSKSFIHSSVGPNFNVLVFVFVVLVSFIVLFVSCSTAGSPEFTPDVLCIYFVDHVKCRVLTLVGEIPR